MIEAVDVIIPVYNGEKYIRVALTSVLGQTVKPQRIVVVNDGSTDCTGDIVDEIAGTAAIPVVHIKQTNRGLSAARNTGIANSSAPLLCFLDADDFWMPNKLESQLKIVQSSPSLGLVYCGYVTCDGDGNIRTGDHWLTPHLRGFCYRDLLGNNYICGSGSAVMIRRECFKKCGIFDEKIGYGEDWDMWLRIARYYPVDFICVSLVVIRIHAESMQKTKHYRSRHLLGRIQIFARNIVINGKELGAFFLMKNTISMTWQICKLLFTESPMSWLRFNWHNRSAIKNYYITVLKAFCRRGNCE